MSKIIDMQKYKDSEFERVFFQYYQHVEDFYEPKVNEKSIMTRLHFGIRYVDTIVDLIKYLKLKGKPSEDLKTFCHQQVEKLKKIAEVLDE